MHSNGFDLVRARSALHALDPGCTREDWHRIGRAAIAAGLTVEDLDSWSSSAPNYKGSRDVASAFRTIKPEGGTSAATLFFLAQQAGWREASGPTRKPPEKAPMRPVAPPEAPKAGMGAAEVWNRCVPATSLHPYIRTKGGKPDGLRVVPEGDPLRIAGLSMVGALVVPIRPAGGGEPTSLQFIAGGAQAQAWKAAGRPTKLNLPNHPVEGVFMVESSDPSEKEPGDVLYIVEGIATGWACHQAGGFPSAVTFGAGRMAEVARELRRADPQAQLVVVADAGKEDEALTIAAEVNGRLVRMPEGSPPNFDAADLMAQQGEEALEDLLSHPESPTIESRLSFVHADAVAGNYEPPDELIEGVLTASGLSVVFGDSNSGKTFLVIDAACAVARGVPWMGRQTEQGLVVYLAAEGPASVRSRLQAYQQHHGLTVPNLVIVQSPIDLFSADADAQEVVKLVRQLEARARMKCRLIVGDTLARLTAGANENAGQDMGKVIARVDAIRERLNAHFLLIHHSGKAQSQGARGWSGIRAAADTEIEVSDGPQGRCAEVTKQRDLGTKGERIGFRLERMELGSTKWGKPATSCIVVPADAPTKPTSRRVSEVAGAVMEFLKTRGRGIRKRELVEHFDGTYASSAIYRELKKLHGAGLVHETAGLVAALKA